jgi:hypothetical protein
MVVIIRVVSIDKHIAAKNTSVYYCLQQTSSHYTVG